MAGHDERVAAQLEKLRLQFLSGGEHINQTGFELRNAPRLPFEHLLRFLAHFRESRFRFGSLSSMQGFVGSHHGFDGNTEPHENIWPRWGVFVLTSPVPVLSGS